MDTNVCKDLTFDSCSGGQHLKTDEVNCIMCRLNKRIPNGSPGHVNWFPATYTGKVCFHNFNFPDMDYTFSLQPERGRGNGLTRWNPPAEPNQPLDGTPKKNGEDSAGPNSECFPRAFHIEFDSREIDTILVEVRFVGQDDIMLSPSHDGPVCYVGGYIFGQLNAGDFFDNYESLMKGFGGRPHWGKHLTLSPQESRHMYPGLDRFNEIRKELDPEGIFANDFVRNLFG